MTALAQRAGWVSWPGSMCGLAGRAADVDSQQKRVYGYRKQGPAFGHTKIGGKSLLVRGLNVLAATVCTPPAAPVIAATRWIEA